MLNKKIYIFIFTLLLSTQASAQAFWQHFGKQNLNIQLLSLHKGGLKGPVNLWFEIYLSHDGYTMSELSESVYYSEPYFTNKSTYITPDEVLTIPKENLKLALKNLESKVHQNLGPEVKVNPSLKLKLYFSKAQNPKQAILAQNAKLTLLADDILAVTDDHLSKKRKVFNNGRHYGYTYSEINLAIIPD